MLHFTPQTPHHDRGRALFSFHTLALLTLPTLDTLSAAHRAAKARQQLERDIAQARSQAETLLRNQPRTNELVLQYNLALKVSDRV